MSKEPNRYFEAARISSLFKRQYVRGGVASVVIEMNQLQFADEDIFWLGKTPDLQGESLLSSSVSSVLERFVCCVASRLLLRLIGQSLLRSSSYELIFTRQWVNEVLTNVSSRTFFLFQKHEF